LISTHDHSLVVINSRPKNMNAFPGHITDAQTTCALRFSGYDYEQAAGIAVEGVVGRGLSNLSKPVIENLTLHTKEEDNFAAFFILQRFLFKWGGEYLTNYSEEHIAFDFLFLDLYRREPPLQFSDARFLEEWNQEYRDSIEPIAAYVRRSFRRRGRGKKLAL